MVRCFYCDVETEIKSDGIDPWVHHAQVSPDCAFLINTRGMRFVNDVCLILRHDSVTVSCGLFGQWVFLPFIPVLIHMDKNI